MKHILAGSNGSGPCPLPVATLIDSVAAEEIKNTAELSALAGNILSVATTSGDFLFLLLDGEPVDPLTSREELWMGPEYFTHQASEILSMDIWDEIGNRWGEFPTEQFSLTDEDGVLRLYPALPRQWRVILGDTLARLWIAERDVWKSL